MNNSITFFLLVLVSLVAPNESFSSVGTGASGKKRNEMPANEIRNRFFCPNCLKQKKELRELETLSELDNPENVRSSAEKKEIHCMKGERGEKGEPGENGESGKLSQEQIAAVIKPLEEKLEDLKSSYTIEIARLKNEMQSLKSNVLHSLGSKSNPAKSCKEIFQHDSSSPSGTYYINVTGGVTTSYCNMDENNGCPVGSTLVMKIDGSKDTFRYSSPLWSNKESYNQNDGQTVYDTKETKLPTYWSIPLTKVCITMKTHSGDIESLIIDHTAKSLYDILADGKYRPTRGSRKVWQSILPGSFLTEGCLRQGFNAHGKKPESAAARIGAIASKKSECSSFESFIGLGTKAGSCGAERKISGGNEAGCHNNKAIQAFGYIFVY